MRSINQWLDEYGESRRNETNKLIHWICVPAIFFSITGLLYCIKLPLLLTPNVQLNVAMIVLALAVIYYFRLSASIGIGMFLFGLFLPLFMLHHRKLCPSFFMACLPGNICCRMDRPILRA